MYWNVGAYLSELCAASSFGDKVIDEVATYSFNRRGLYRIRQFYETYKDDEFVTPLVTQISWTNHLLIMSGSKARESTLEKKCQYVICTPIPGTRYRGTYHYCGVTRYRCVVPT